MLSVREVVAVEKPEVGGRVLQEGSDFATQEELKGRAAGPRLELLGPLAARLAMLVCEDWNAASVCGWRGLESLDRMPAWRAELWEHVCRAASPWIGPCASDGAGC